MSVKKKIIILLAIFLVFGVIFTIIFINRTTPEEEMLEVVKMLKKYTRQDTPLSKYQAYTYLNISRATFDNLVREGKLPKGKKQAGFKELCWYKKDLKKCANGGITKAN